MRREIDTLTPSSPYEEALEVMYILLQEDSLHDFLSEQPKYEVKQIRELLDFPKTDLFKKQFEIQWQYETGSQWKDRTVETALQETVLHTLTAISGGINMYQRKSAEFKENHPILFELISQQAPDELGRIQRKADVLGYYFDWKFQKKETG